MDAKKFRKIWQNQNKNIVHILSEHELELMESYARYYHEMKLSNDNDNTLIRDELIDALDDKRITKLLGVDENMYYLSRKETADYLLEKYFFNKKSMKIE